MAGDPTKASLWANADVYYAPVGTTAPTDTYTAPAVAWKLVGLLDGDEGMTEARDEDTSEHYAWGGILVKSTRSKHKRTIKFVALEDNDNVFALVNPGSDRAAADVNGVVVDTVRVPVAQEYAFLFEVRDGDKVRRRIVKRGEITEVGEIKDSEADLTAYEMTTTLYPESDGELYKTLTGPAEDPTP
ncbi:hypothetical protein OG474_09645 [Kribbella sp. NBC_01505]|uniref:phage tail tube protein n=1 Tax=Kribbella sp. NBC_01505 TaxID=2903580 RepID=UPI0038696D60